MQQMDRQIDGHKTLVQPNKMAV